MIDSVTLHWAGEMDAFWLQHLGEWLNTGIGEVPGVDEHTLWVVAKMEHDEAGVTIEMHPQRAAV